jgi:hypothetical protein
LLPRRLTWIDATNRDAHSYLVEDDRCLFFGEYFAHQGYEGGYTNDLILNFKIKPSALRKNPARARYKTRAIAEVAECLRNVAAAEHAARYTWVPVPPSKAVGDPDYDDRLERTLRAAFDPRVVDIRNLLRQTESTEADHLSGDRLTPEQLYAILDVDETAAAVAPVRERGVILFDDVLTTGKHFMCCKRRLREHLGDIPVTGLFIARRVPPDVSIEFDVILDDE